MHHSGDIRVGESSPRVAQVRSGLARLGMLPDYQGNVADGEFSDADAMFDQALSEVLKAFQQSRGILPSGIIDDTTVREVRRASYRLGNRILAFQPGNEMVGDDVTQLQDQLQELGFYDGRVDGHFNKLTHEALRDYQLNSGIEADGTCGPDTLRALSLLGRRITGGSPQAIKERESVRAAGPKLAGKRVVLDPALGGANKGQTVQGRFGSISEEEILWDLTHRVEGRMVAAGIETIISRTRNDNPSLRDRAEIANAFGADLVISLHCDHYPNEKANGVASFYFGSEIGSSSLTGEMLSGYIQREIAARTDLLNCGNHARTWDLMRLTEMPTVETYVGYLSNPEDVSVITDPKQRDIIADAIVVAIKRLYMLDEDHATTGHFRFEELLAAEHS